MAMMAWVMGDNAPATTRNNTTAPGHFALVELFTSEGCSSCPPADEAMIRLLQTYREAVFVVGFHVDYWDRLGWKDAFSDAAYTRRQQEYGAFFNLESIYTPQVVVNGKFQFVGSDERRLRQVVDEELVQTSSPDKMDIRATLIKGNRIRVLCTTVPQADVQWNLALVQLHAESHVGKGENQGKLLHHVNIVREFRSINPVGMQDSLFFSIPSGLSAADCRVIGWLQNRSNRKIMGVLETSIR